METLTGNLPGGCTSSSRIGGSGTQQRGGASLGRTCLYGALFVELFTPVESINVAVPAVLQ